MPSSAPVSMAAVSLSSRFSSIIFLTSGELIMISSAGVMLPSTVGDHALADDAAQRAGELAADLFAFIRLEKIQDARDGLRGVGGVQRGQDQMPGVRRAHGGA